MWGFAALAPMKNRKCIVHVGLRCARPNNIEKIAAFTSMWGSLRLAPITCLHTFLSSLLSRFLPCFLACILACCLSWFIAHFLACILAELCLPSLCFSLLSSLSCTFLSCFLACIAVGCLAYFIAQFLELNYVPSIRPSVHPSIHPSIHNKLKVVHPTPGQLGLGVIFNTHPYEMYCETKDKP